MILMQIVLAAVLCGVAPTVLPGTAKENTPQTTKRQLASTFSSGN